MACFKIVTDFANRCGVINVKEILAVINATYVVAKRKPEKKNQEHNFRCGVLT